MAISKIQNISKEELTRIEKVIGESFVTNELFHNWGTIEERRSSVLAYMKIYVDCVYRAGELYSNETLTGFVGIEDTRRPATAAKINMLFKMIFMLPLSKIKSLMHFIKQIHSSNAEYGKKYTWEQYSDIVFRHSQRQVEPYKWVYDINPLFKDDGPTLYTVKCSGQEAEIYVPFNHRLYTETEKQARERFRVYERYWRQPVCLRVQIWQPYPPILQINH